MNAPVLPPTRPALRYHGGKWRLAPWIIEHLPAHRTYVEPFGGAASVLLRKRRAYAEVYNDLDGEVVAFFRVLQDTPAAARLISLLELTPFARDEFALSYEDAADPVEAARRLVARSFMGFGSNAHASSSRGHRSTGFRANSSRSGTTPAQDWRNYPAALVTIIERFRGVVIENRDALAVMAQHDAPTTLHYVDPPYQHHLRAPAGGDIGLRGMYRHEMVEADHLQLLEALLRLDGMVVLSGYPDALYDDALRSWTRVETRAFADGARERTEVLWINPAAWLALRAAAGPLFAGEARR